jgi:glycosyltransferase involved in cell wall biosynthesis
MKEPAVSGPPEKRADSQAPSRLDGWLGEATRFSARGWAVDLADLASAVRLVVEADGRVVARTIADRDQPWLASRNLGGTRHGFQVWYPPLAPNVDHEIRILREEDGRDLPNSPVMVPVGTHLDPATERWLSHLLLGLTDEAERGRALAFLARETELLLARHADRQSGREEREALRLLRRRWGSAALESADPTLEPAMASRILVIDDLALAPHPLGRSHGLTAHIHLLGALGWEVSYVAARSMNDAGAMERIAAALSVKTCAAPVYYSVEDVFKRQRGCFDAVYVNGLASANRYLALAREYQPMAQIAFSVGRLDDLVHERRADVEARPELAAAGRRLGFLAFVASQMADVVIAHSTHEARILAARLPAKKVHAVAAPFACNPTHVPFAARSGLAFVGPFEHLPNRDAAHWLLTKIMPLVWAQNPTLRCVVIGPGWNGAELATQNDRVAFIDPAETESSALSGFRLTVAPLRFDSGLSWGALESFAAGVPCVMTGVAAEGLPLSPPLEQLVAQAADAFAHAILRYHMDERANLAASEAGLAMVAEHFSDERVRQALAAAIPNPDR